MSFKNKGLNTYPQKITVYYKKYQEYILDNKQKDQ